MTSHGQAEARLRAAVESSPSGMIMIDAAGEIVLVNREFERLFGYSRDELLNRSVDMLVPERLRGGHAGFRVAFFANPQVRAMGAGRDLFGVRKDGREVPVEIGLNPLVTDEGVFVLASVVDITERKRAELELRRSNEDIPAPASDSRSARRSWSDTAGGSGWNPGRGRGRPFISRSK